MYLGDGEMYFLQIGSYQTYIGKSQIELFLKQVKHFVLWNPVHIVSSVVVNLPLLFLLYPSKYYTGRQTS